MVYKFLFAYLLIINLVSFFVCVSDKRRAVKHKSRVPEKTLLFLSLIGGSVGMYATMKAIRHKTLHKRFMIGIPLIIVLQICLVFAVIYLTR